MPSRTMHHIIRNDDVRRERSVRAEPEDSVESMTVREQLNLEHVSWYGLIP